MNLKALLAEFIGTTALIFVGAGAVAIGVGGVVGAALAHGLILTGMIYAYGSISGGHFNPAVTLALALNGAIGWTQAVSYWAAQFLGGAVGAALLYFVLGGAQTGLGATIPLSGLGYGQIIAVEAFLTFLLINTILHTAIKDPKNRMAGMAIGFTFAAAILIGGPLTGASLNPARSFGPALFTDTLPLVWIYLVGPALGAGLAALVYRVLTAKEEDSPGEETS